MSRQQMAFQLAYGAAQEKAKCKSCQGVVEADHLIVGVKSESMYDPMWYHSHCFWTRCWYRKQMSRHLDDYTQLEGFSKLTSEDQQRFKDALDELTGDVDVTSTGLKKRAVSDDNLLDTVNSKKSKPEAITLPKLPLSATELLSKSSSNLATEESTANKECCLNQEEISVTETLVVTVSRTSEGTSLLLGAPTPAGDKSSSTFSMSREQWEKMTSAFNDVTDAIKSSTETGEREFPLVDSQAIHVDRGDNGVSITLDSRVDSKTEPNSEGHLKDLTFTPDQWRDLTAKADDIDAAILRVSA